MIFVIFIVGVFMVGVDCLLLFVLYLVKIVVVSILMMISGVLFK